MSRREVLLTYSMPNILCLCLHSCTSCITIYSQ
jgi:hypothetical protein